MVALPMRCFWAPLIVQSSSQTNELAKDSALVFAYGSIRRNDFHWFCGHGTGTRSFWSESVQTCKRKPLCKVFAQSGLGFGHSLSKYSKCIKRITICVGLCDKTNLADPTALDRLQGPLVHLTSSVIAESLLSNHTMLSRYVKIVFS